MIGMDEGARRANAELRVQGERRDRKTTIELLRDIRDSLARIEEILEPHPPIIPKKITPDIVPLDDGGLAQKAQKPPKEDEEEIPELPPSDEGELLEKK